MELNRCPFCGGQVYPMYWSKTDRHYILHYRREDGKDCQIQTVELTSDVRTLAQAIEAWNRRAEK